MADRKTFLYGLGSGLIAGALLLQLASIGEGDAAADLEAAATANGYVLKDARTAWYSESELQDRIEEAVAQARREAADGATGAAPEQSAAGNDPSAANGGKSDKIYAFTIASGSELTTIARLLYELGLIDDYNGFLRLMEERGLAGKVQAKHYRFDSIPTMDELIEELTS